jgi:hypothetical protein
MALKKIQITFSFLFFLLFASQSGAKNLDSCDIFLQTFEKNFDNARTYLSYECRQGITADGKNYLNITGRPGTASTDSFTNFSGSNCVFYSYSSSGNRYSRVYQLYSFKIIFDRNDERYDVENKCSEDIDSAHDRYFSDRGDCKSTQNLIKEKDPAEKRLALAKLAKKQGCENLYLDASIKTAELEISRENSRKILEEIEQKKLRDAECSIKVRSCQRISGIDVRVKELIARRMATDVDRIRLARIQEYACGCYGVFYTPKGPFTCIVEDIRNNIVQDVRACD